MSAGDQFPSGCLNLEFSFPSNLSDDFNLLMKSVKNHSHSKLNRNQQLFQSCFTFIMRNTGQNLSSTKFLSTHTKAKNSYYLKIALKCVANSALNKCTSCMPVDRVPVDTVLYPTDSSYKITTCTLITNSFGIGVMLLTLFLQLNKG